MGSGSGMEKAGVSVTQGMTGGGGKIRAYGITTVHSLLL